MPDASDVRLPLEELRKQQLALNLPIPGPLMQQPIAGGPVAAAGPSMFDAAPAKPALPSVAPAAPAIPAVPPPLVSQPPGAVVPSDTRGFRSDVRLPSPVEPQFPMAERAEALAVQGRPQYHGWAKLGDILAQMHPIGRAIEAGAGIGTIGYENRLAEAQYGAAGERVQAEIEGREELRKAQEELAQARTEAPKERTVDVDGKPVVQQWDAGTRSWVTEPGITPYEKPEKIPEADKPLAPAEIDRNNASFTDYYQVLNPNKPLPPEFTLQPGATRKDVDRVDKMMKQVESATATKAQQETLNEMRRQTLAIQQQTAAQREEKAGRQWVQWTDPQSGRTIAGPVSMADAAGAVDTAALGARDVQDIREARNVVTIINKRGDVTKPESMGITQLINSLEGDGKLGIVASRLNSFLSGRVGTLPGDDPRIITLLDKAKLAVTASMKAHFGTSGGRSPQMLEHFLRLADARKMDAVALRAGFLAIQNYMQDRGMMQAPTFQPTRKIREVPQ